MPRIVPPYTYPDGTKLDVESHNEAVFGESGTGLMATVDGNLDINNFNENFRIQPEHVMPEQAAIGRQDWDQYETTLFSDGIGVNQTDFAINRFNVPGCSVRFYQPYDATMALLQWSFFISHTKWRIARTTKQGDNIEPNMFVISQLDGVDLSHTLRPLPISAITDGFSSTQDSQVINCEPHNALWFDMSHLEASGLSKGWHELRLQMAMEHVVDNDGSNYQQGFSIKFGKTLREFDFYTMQKAAFGIRNARVLTML
tara:strand:- start:23 stop:793 length:771 start_codon:yes stop_codon:yes gene_type:complete